MRKEHFVAFFWVLILAVPFTALALSGTAYVTDHLIGLATTLGSTTNAIGKPWILEIAERLPEVAGMVAGQLIILVILILARATEPKEAKGESKNR